MIEGVLAIAGVVGGIAFLLKSVIDVVMDGCFSFYRWASIRASVNVAQAVWDHERDLSLHFALFPDIAVDGKNLQQWRVLLSVDKEG